MPREQINYPPELVPTAEYPASPRGRTSWRDPALHVSWWPADKDDMPGHVQVYLDTDNTQLVDLIGEADPAKSLLTSVYTPQLTRAEINKLIQTLRRARDQAYGADE